MPELPEVETVVRGLRNVLPGRRIVEVRLGKTDFIEDPVALGRYLPGRQIAGVRRIGKFIVLEFDGANGDADQFTLLIHLGMTGQIVTCAPADPIAPHTHVFFLLDDGREMRYTDIRRFGQMRILTESAREEVLGKLGIDPLEGSRMEFFVRIWSGRRQVKALLLDQHVLRGMGNIYTDESLFRARIHPKSLGASLSTKEIYRLHQAVRDVLNEAIQMRGSSISDYVDSEGRQGEFQLRHRVYQREGKKCFRCSTAIRRVIVAGRSSYYCPVCQSRTRKRSGEARKWKKT